ncbi:hypothetical protein BS47DRAFT_1338971 [Hydnum rufescens UP504]|uniref:Uncharacterized protein n=1 Tax=Hydnum rufescens UP504 TaxID=1448309 RepID=A0A9P6E123_9AGAM|nr:hypothetical protein BS47DRAFT_1338971 [Hydnum rufescens UP504]
MSPSLVRALSSLCPFPQGNRIIATDFSRTVLINSADENLTSVLSEVTLSQSRPLRYLLTSYIHEALPAEYFDLDTEYRFIPQGAPNDPDLPLPPDHEILSTHTRHSDFDRYTLVNNRAAAEQFFRWKASKCAERVLTLVGTAIHAESLGFMERHRPFQPRYRLEPLPEPTRAHLIATARPAFPHFVSLLNGSRSFSLLLDEELTPSEGTGYARTFSCRLTAVDGQLPSGDVPKNLCVKLFDDHAASVPSLSDYPSLRTWSQDFYTAEDMLQNEVNAYMRLEHAWGTVVPYFYGTHRVSELVYPALAVRTVLLVHTSGWTAPGWDSDGVCDEVREEPGPTFRCCSNRISARSRSPHSPIC